MTLAEEIAAFQARYDLTIPGVACMIGISPAAVRRILRGGRPRGAVFDKCLDWIKRWKGHY